MDPVTEEAQEEEGLPVEEEPDLIEESVQDDPEVEVVIEEITDETSVEEEINVEIQDDVQLEGNAIDEDTFEEEVSEVIGEESQEEAWIEEEPIVDEPITEEAIVEETVEVIVDELQEEAELEQDATSETIEGGLEVEETIEQPLVDEATIVEPVIAEELIVERVFEEQIIPRYVSLRIGVEPSSERYTNGDLIRYEISIENNGTDPIESLDIVDDMGVDESIGYLNIGERIIVTGSYRIDDYNRMESIGNTVRVSAICDGERISGDVGFVVQIGIPQGSIIISNSVLGAAEDNAEFTILVEGPDNYVDYVEMGDSETVILRNLFIGDYRITPLECMNFRSSGPSETSITTDSLNRDVSVEYSLVNTGWFSDSYFQTIKVMDVDSVDIDFSKIELQSSDLDNRSDEIYLDLEPLIVLVEVQVEALQQPEGEESSSVADPVQEVTSEPVEAGLQEEVTEPDAAEGTEELEPIATEETGPLVVEGTEEQGSTEETDPVMTEELGGQEELLDQTSEEPGPATEEVEETQQTDIEEPQAVIPEDPLVESNEEMETGEMDEGTEETDSETQSEGAVVPADSEEMPIDPV